MPDDDITERRLRELLRDPAWSLRPWPDAQARVRRAARRQRAKAASLAACTIAIAATAVAVALATLGGRVQGAPIPSTHASTPSSEQHCAVHGQMPMVIGLKVQPAEAEIRAAVSKPDIIVRHARAPVPPGIVFVQIPAAGTRLAPGCRITLKVSNGN